jgi:hypothetical protein
MLNAISCFLDLTGGRIADKRPSDWMIRTVTWLIQPMRVADHSALGRDRQPLTSNRRVGAARSGYYARSMQDSDSLGLRVERRAGLLRQLTTRYIAITATARAGSQTGAE